MPNFGDLTWTTIEQMGNADSRPKIILPVGSFEQHGPHLPLSTDTIIAEYVAGAVAKTCSSLLMPSLQISYSPEHLGFPGTISLTAQTFMTMIEEISANLFQSGFRTLLVINGHGGNKSILDATFATIKHTHPDLQLYSFTVLDIARTKFEEIRESSKKMIGHADELETSVMLAIRPDLVEMSRALAEKPSFPTDVSLETEDLARVTFGWRAREVTKSGVIGSPDMATPEKGRALLDFVIQTISTIVARM